MRVLLANRRQAIKVRLVLWSSLLACAGALYWGWDLSQSYGLNPGDGGVLRPFGERLALALLVAALGLAFAGSVMIYASLYVVHLASEGGQLTVATLTPWGVGSWRHAFDVAQVGGSSYYHGRMRTSRHNVNAPWFTLRIEGRWLPFILDVQSETFQKGAIENLARSEKKRRRKERG